MRKSLVLIIGCYKLIIGTQYNHNILHYLMNKIYTVLRKQYPYNGFMMITCMYASLLMALMSLPFCVHEN